MRVANSHSGVKSKRYSKYALYRILCLGYDSDKKEKENRDLGCSKHFTTKDPDRQFCSDICRVRVWSRTNKDKINEKQRQYRLRKKKEFDKMVQDLIDSSGVQEN